MFAAGVSIEAVSLLAVAFGSLGLIALLIAKHRSKPGILNQTACFAFHLGWLMAGLMFFGTIVFHMLPRALDTDPAARLLWCSVGSLIVFGAIFGTCDSLLAVVPTVILSSGFACIAMANATGSRDWFDPATVMAGIAVGAIVVVVQWLRLRNE